MAKFIYLFLRKTNLIFLRKTNLIANLLIFSKVMVVISALVLQYRFHAIAGKLFILNTFLIFSMAMNAQTQSVTFTSSGIWTVPTGVTQITVEAWGGGGAGGNISGGNTIGIARGGGGGAYARGTLNVISGTIYTVVVGNGGSNPGGSGNPSLFGTGPLILAAGGNGGSSNTSGNGGTGGTLAGSIGDIVYRGGNAVAGGGGGAGSNGQGGDANGSIGGFGTPESGGNGGSVPTGNNNGNSGFNFGGGGSGAIKSNNGSPQTGGSGADGRIVISWCQSPSITNQPANQNITYGESTIFSVLSGTSGVNYQWQVTDDEIGRASCRERV